MSREKKPRARVHNRDRHTEILAAAKHVFTQCGFEAATTAEIARLANVAEGTIYRYAVTKRDLLEQVIVGWYEEMSSELKAGLESTQCTREKLAIAVRHQFKVFSDHAPVAQLMVREMRAKVAGERGRIDVLNRAYTRLLIEVLIDGQSNGSIRQDLSLTMARDIFFGTIEHAAMTRSSIDEAEAQVENFIREYWAVVSNPAKT